MTTWATKVLGRLDDIAQQTATSGIDIAILVLSIFMVILGGLSLWLAMYTLRLGHSERNNGQHANNNRRGWFCRLFRSKTHNQQVSRGPESTQPRLHIEAADDASAVQDNELEVLGHTNAVAGDNQ